MRQDDHSDGGNIDAVINRTFAAPPKVVFEAWITIDGLREWFAPEGFTVTMAEANPVDGGSWQVEMRSADGDIYLEYGDYRDISSPNRLSMTLTQAHQSDVGPRTLVTVNFIEKSGRTEMSFLQEGFQTTERRDGNIEGWQQCFDKLDAYLSAD